MFSSKKDFHAIKARGIFSLFLLLIIKTYKSAMTDTQRNHVAPYGSFKPIPTNPTPSCSTTSIPADYYSQNSTLYLTAEEAHEPSNNSDAIPFTKEQLEHLYKLVKSPKLSLQKGNPLVTVFLVLLLILFILV